MLDKLLKEAVASIVGKSAENLADILNSKDYVNEFVIAKKLDITINQARNLLYKLADHGIVSSIRKKDRKKGWYTYFWKIEILKTLEFLRAILTKKIEMIRNQVKSREMKEFYVCEKCNIEHNEENALLHNFECSECGNVFSLKDNSKVLKELKRQADKFVEEMKFIEDEIANEKENLLKKKEKELKKVAKKKEKDKKKFRQTTGKKDKDSSKKKKKSVVKKKIPKSKKKKK